MWRCETAATALVSVRAAAPLDGSMRVTDGARPMPPGEEVRSGLREHLPRLWRYGLVLARRRDVAEDLVQATCMRALERAHQFQSGTRLDRWLLAILHSIWLNEVRAQRIRAGQGFVDAEAVLTVDGAAQMDERLLAGDVLRRVGDLPEAQRAAIFLAYVEGMAYREVAEILDIPVGTVMSRLASARARLAEAFAADDRSEVLGR